MKSINLILLFLLIHTSLVYGQSTYTYKVTTFSKNKTWTKKVSKDNYEKCYTQFSIHKLTKKEVKRTSATQSRHFLRFFTVREYNKELWRENKIIASSLKDTLIPLDTIYKFLFSGKENSNVYIDDYKPTCLPAYKYIGDSLIWNKDFCFDDIQGGPYYADFNKFKACYELYQTKIFRRDRIFKFYYNRYNEVVLSYWKQKVLRGKL